jgi:hypothetical protein
MAGDMAQEVECLPKSIKSWAQTQVPSPSPAKKKDSNNKISEALKQLEVSRPEKHGILNGQVVNWSNLNFRNGTRYLWMPEETGDWFKVGFRTINKYKYSQTLFY